MIVINGKKDDIQQELFLLNFKESIDTTVLNIKNYVCKESIYSIENENYKLFYLNDKYLKSDTNTNLDQYKNIYDLKSVKYVFYRKYDDKISLYSFYLSNTVNIKSNSYTFLFFDDHQSHIRISGYLKDKLNIRLSKYINISNIKDILFALVNSKVF